MNLQQVGDRPEGEPNEQAPPGAPAEADPPPAEAAPADQTEEQEREPVEP